MIRIMTHKIDRDCHDPITLHTIPVNTGDPAHPRYMVPVYYHNMTECTICYGIDTGEFVVVDCEYDAQLRDDMPDIYHLTFQSAYDFIKRMEDEADMLETCEQQIQYLTAEFKRYGITVSHIEYTDQVWTVYTNLGMYKMYVGSDDDWYAFINTSDDSTITIPINDD